MTKVIHLQPQDPLIGDWVPADLYSDIVISISKESDEYIISVVDTDDDEKAEVYDVKYEKSELSFNVHWASNGRFIKYGLLLLSNNTVRLIYTYSGQETWVRQDT